MFLVKNKLKKVKNKYDDDEYLHYLKYSHLEPKNITKSRMVEAEDKATQEPDIMNNFSQTVKKDMADKETDTGSDLGSQTLEFARSANATYDELNKIIGNYILMMNSKNFKSREPSRAEKMTMAFTQMIEPRERQKSSSSSSSDSSGFLGKGFRLAEMAGNAVITTFNVASDLADFLVDATAPRQQNSDEEVEEEQQEEEQPSGSNDAPTFMRERSRSHDSDLDLGERLLRRGASRSRSSTPDKNPKKKM